MMRNCAILLLLCGVILNARATANDELTHEIESDELMKTSDLEQAETKDASATEIIKQIRKLNPDGTFTIGYEADDGSFKIETRDLQGNVKQGTYGYVDGNGEVKRVQYSLQNNTLLKEYQQTTEATQTSSSSIEGDDENETINLAQSSRYNRSSLFASTTRRPAALAYLTNPYASTTKNHQQQPSVVQTIPKRRLLNSLEKDKDKATLPVEGTSTVVYATSVPTPKPYLSRSTTSPSYSRKHSEKGVEIDQVERKVYIATAQKESVTTMKPILLKNDKSEEKVDLKRGNALRRQLKADLEENIEAQQQVLYGDGDESSAIYGSSFGNVRPLFSSQQSKIPLQVLAARQRATQLQNILSNSQSGTTSSTTTSTTEKVYTKAPKRQSRIKLEDVQPDVVNENYLGAQQEQFPVPIENEERRPFPSRPLPPNLEGLYRPRNYLRQLQQQQQQQVPSGADLQDIRQPPQGLPNGQRFFPQQNQPQPQQSNLQNLYPEQQQGSDFLGYSGGSPFFPPRNPYNDYDRPLTVRDFERLLQVLVYRQQYQSRVNPFYPASNPLSYPPFIPNYNTQNPYSQIPRPPFYNNPLTTGLFDPGYQNPYYSPSMPVAQQADTMQDQNQDVQPRFQQQRRRQYNSRFLSQQPQQTQVPSPPVAPSEQELSYNSVQGPVDNFLPPSVREQLLYRMLMLAIRGESPQQHQQHLMPLQSSASSLHSVLEPEQSESTLLKSTSERSSVSKKPVRSVLILGEEREEEEEQQ